MNSTGKLMLECLRLLMIFEVQTLSWISPFVGCTLGTVTIYQNLYPFSFWWSKQFPILNGLYLWLLDNGALLCFAAEVYACERLAVMNFPSCQLGHFAKPLRKFWVDPQKEFQKLCSIDLHVEPHVRSKIIFEEKLVQIWSVIYNLFKYICLNRKELKQFKT